MNILFTALGTRGDVQPIVALGKGLVAAGHSVCVAAGKNFADWIGAQGLAFAPLAIDIQAMMQSPEGIAWVEAGNQLAQLKHMRGLFDSVGAQAGHDIAQAAQDTSADVLIGSFTSDGLAYSVAEKQKLCYVSLALQPLYPTVHGQATVLPLIAQGKSIFNKISAHCAEYFLFGVGKNSGNQFRRQLGLAPFTTRSYYAAMHALTLLQGYSTHIVPRPSDWKENMRMTGYWFLDEPAWQAPPELNDFIVRGTKPIYIGFGSATASNAAATSQMIVRVVKKLGVRVVLAQGWAGLSADALSDNIYMLKAAPHSWLFPKMAGVVHHGGAGTTAAGFRAGVPQLVVPHFAEQPYWARRTHELGVGVAPISKKILNEQNFAEGLRALMQNTNTSVNACELGKKIRAEDGVANAVTAIEQLRRNR